MTPTQLKSAEDFALYEMPTIAQYIGNRFLQEILARYTAWIVNRKLRRYEKRLKLQAYCEYLKSIK